MCLHISLGGWGFSILVNQSWFAQVAAADLELPDKQNYDQVVASVGVISAVAQSINGAVSPFILNLIRYCLQAKAYTKGLIYVSYSTADCDSVGISVPFMEGYHNDVVFTPKQQKYEKYDCCITLLFFFRVKLHRDKHFTRKKMNAFIVFCCV